MTKERELVDAVGCGVEGTGRTVKGTEPVRRRRRTAKATRVRPRDRERYSSSAGGG